MLIFRYLIKEVVITLIALTSILLLIFMSNQFVNYLSRAAIGQIPIFMVLKLMLLELPNLLALLLPLGFYISLIIAYGRLYADNELVVLGACGYGESSLLKHSLFLAVMLAIFIAVLVFFVSPKIASARVKILQTTGISTLIQTILPGRFRTIVNDNEVFYIDSINRKKTKAHNFFFARNVSNKPQKWQVITAESVAVSHDNEKQLDYLIFKNGNEYEGEPGKADYQLSHFKVLKKTIKQPSITPKEDVRTISTKQLFLKSNLDLREQAELQWRFSVVFMVITLTLVAVPLSRVNARIGKYGKLLPAILLYTIYANFMFVSRNWIISKKISPYLGMWWLHLVIAAIGVFLYLRQRKIK